MMYFLNAVAYFLYMQTANYFYYLFNSNTICKKRIKLLFVLQLLGVVFYPYLKENYNGIASLISYFLFFLGSIIYDISLKDRFIYFVFLLVINVCGEMMTSSIIIFVLTFILNKDVMFIDELSRTNQFYFFIALLGVVGCVFLFIKYIEKMSKSIDHKQLKQIIKICFLPLVLVFFSFNFIYTASKDTFFIVFIVSLIIVVIAIFIIVKGINKYQMMQRESIKNKAQQEILNMQIEDMKSIDQYYKTIRRKNHDLKNHCLVVLNMLENHDEKVKEYLLSMKEGNDK